jgi:hypothetical protein
MFNKQVTKFAFTMQHWKAHMSTYLPELPNGLSTEEVMENNSAQFI